MRRAGPSQIRPGDRYCVRLYLNHSADPQVFDNCKHVWVQAGTNILVILQMFDNDDTHRYLYWPMGTVLWWQVTPMRVERVWRDRDPDDQ